MHSLTKALCRAQRHHRRRARGLARAHRPGALVPEGARRLHGPPRGLPGPARPEDRCTCAWPGSARTRWPWPGTSRAIRKVAPRDLSRPALAPGPRGGAPADGGLRRHGVAGPRGGPRRRRALLRPARAGGARGQPGRSRVAGEPARPHLAPRVHATSSFARRASIRARCACPSASRTRPTSSPTSSRPSPAREARGQEEHGERDDPEPGPRGSRRLLRRAAPPRLPRLRALPPRASHRRPHLAGAALPPAPLAGGAGGGQRGPDRSQRADGPARPPRREPRA